MIRVVKRNGRIESLDITKIQKYTSAAVKGLSGVSQSELEVDAKLHFRDMITTKEIQETLIKTAVEKIDVDRPNWTFVAARLFLYDIYHRVSGFTGYIHLRDYFERGEKEGRIIPGLKDKYDLDDLNDYIKPERDLQFTYLGLKTLYDRYLIKDKEGEPIELPQHMFMAIAMFLAQNEFNAQDWAKRFYDLISKFEIMLATPTLSNARTTRHQLSSCFLKGTKVRGIDKEINIEEIKEGDYVLTHTKEFKRVIERFERDFNGNLIELKINGLLRELSATQEHPIYSIKKEDIKCIRKLSFCLFNQGRNKRCFKLEGEYKRDCERLEEDLTQYIKWNSIESLKEGDFVSISFSNYTHNKKEILISDIIRADNLINDKEYIFLKRSSCSFINDRGFINTQIQKVKNKIPLNKEFMLLLGYYLAKGYISKDKDSVIFTFSSKEKEYIDEAVKLIKDIFDYEAKVTLNSDNSTSVAIHNKIIASFFDALVGNGFNKKRLSPLIKYAFAPAQEWLLVGAFRGDGCAIEEGVQLTLSNQPLIEELFEIALRCKLSPFMFKGAKNEIANYYPYYLKIGAKQDREFIKKVNKNLNKINLEPQGNSQLRYFWFNNLYFMRIENKNIKACNQKVYNIEVEDDHSYSVNLVDVHNCYIGSTPDNIEGIFDSYKEMALLSKYGGGIGWDWSLVRGMGSYIDGHKNAAGGIIPFLKIANDVAIAVDQLGTRKGAIAVYIEPWHIDVREFIELKKNAGEERRRAHDLFPALWVNDLFMERAANDDKWTLFDPYEVPELTELYGEEFNKKYIEYENRDDITKEVVSAKALWKEILRNYFETGNPFLTFKDNANRANPNRHAGIIRSSNLCTEIFQNTQPNYYKIRVNFEDGSYLLFDEDEEVRVDSGIVKKAKKITALDTIEGKKIFIVDKEKFDGDTAVCNLASVNLSKINTLEDIKRVVPIAIRMLDNVIDLNFYPLAKVKKTNLKTRAIGLGVMGEAQMLAEAGIEWGSDEHLKKIDEVMESISYYAIEASSNLALEKGKYPLFEGSDWSKGIFPIDKANKEAAKLIDRGGLFGYTHDWAKLKEKVKRDGMRNGYLMAIAPTSSISILVGTTQAIEPIYKRKWYEVNLSGEIPVTAPNINPDTWPYYISSYDLDQRVLVKAAAIRQKWIDQGQSLNIFIRLDKASGRYLNDIYMLAWLEAWAKINLLSTKSISRST